MFASSLCWCVLTAMVCRKLALFLLHSWLFSFSFFTSQVLKTDKGSCGLIFIRSWKQCLCMVFPFRLFLLKHSRIWVIIKNGRRTPHNFPEVAKFARSVLHVPVDFLQNVERLSVRQQFHLVRRYSVLVTPSGGIAFIYGFLPVGASVIFLDYWHALHQQVGQMNGHLFSHDWRHRQFHFQIVNQSEVTLNRDDVFEWERSDDGLAYRGFACFRLDPYRMTYYIFHALPVAQDWMNLDEEPIPLPEFLRWNASNPSYPSWLPVDQDLTRPLYWGCLRS